MEKKASKCTFKKKRMLRTSPNVLKIVCLVFHMKLLYLITMLVHANDKHVQGGTPKTHNYLLESGLLIIHASLLGECSRDSSVSVYQLVVL